jgi:3'-5' exonuclease
MSEGFDHYVFIDIETVSQAEDFGHLDEYAAQLWDDKEGRKREELQSAEDYYASRAAIFSEFGKIICISAGYFRIEGGEPGFRVKSCYGHDEAEVIKEFFGLLEGFHHNFRGRLVLCGHNVKEFDVPYVCRRAIINHITLPVFLADMQSKKPWEIPLEDTMQMWKFGDFKNYTSLKLLAHVLGIPSPKDDIDGSQVGYVYWKEKDLERIKNYCQKDVFTTAQVFLRLKAQPLVRPERVVYLT